MENKVSHVGDSNPVTADGQIRPSSSDMRILMIYLVSVVAVVIGLMLAILWSPAIADDVIGENVANTILGTNAASFTIQNVLFGTLFAIVSGLATTFTACNCVVFSCLAPLVGEKRQARITLGHLLLWMCVGVIVVTGIYGLVGAFVGNRLPSLSQSVMSLPTGESFPVRLLQSSAVFVIVGIVLLFWGLTSLKKGQVFWSRFTERRPWLTPLFLGVIVGFFSVGRPYPLFHKLLSYTAGTGNPLLSALLIALQGLGNIALMLLIFLILTYGTRGRFERWLRNNPMRSKILTAVSLIGGGTFLIAYWGIRVPALFGIGWFPHL